MQQASKFIAIGLLVLSLSGCKTKCEELCERHIQCFPEETENSVVGAVVGAIVDLDCKWEDGSEDATIKCVSACNKEFDQLSYAVQDEVSICIDCQLKEGGDTGEGCSDYDKMFSKCDAECDDSEVEDFFSDFNKEADLAGDIDCD